jgi:hypothetical protein
MVWIGTELAEDGDFCERSNKGFGSIKEENILNGLATKRFQRIS